MNKTNDMESVIPCSGQYSFKRDMKLSVWILVTAVTYGVTVYLLGRGIEWGSWERMLLRLIPLLPLGLWLRDLMGFLRGLDELQRNLQIKVWLFAALGTLVVVTGANVLIESGFSVDSVGLAGAICWLVVFWGVGSAVATRRYR